MSAQVCGDCFWSRLVGYGPCRAHSTADDLAAFKRKIETLRNAPNPAYAFIRRRP